MTNSNTFPMDDPSYAATYAEEAAMVDASELIAEALIESGKTKTELAALLGVNKSEVTARLRGERNVTVRKLAATLHVLGRRLELSSVPTRTSTSHEAQITWSRKMARIIPRPASVTSCNHSNSNASQYRGVREKVS